MPAVRIAGSAAGRAAGDAVLLAAVRVEDGLELVFSKVLAEEVRVLASVRDEFDSWTEVGVVPSGAASHVMAGVNVPGGSRSVLVQGRSQTAPWGDRLRDGPAPGDGLPGRERIAWWRDGRGPADLISDPGLLEKFLAALSQLASVASARLAACGRPAVPRGEGADAGPAPFGSIPPRKTGWPTPTTRRRPWTCDVPLRHGRLSRAPGPRREGTTAGCGNQRTRSSKRRSLGLDSDDAGAVNDDGDRG